MNIATNLAADHARAVNRASINVAIAGLGAIGQTLVRALAGGTVPGVALKMRHSNFNRATRGKTLGHAPISDLQLLTSASRLQ